MSSPDKINEGNPTDKCSNVAIKSHAIQKPFLGGYRNIKTGSVYHHAKVQTVAPPWKTDEQVPKFHRDCQTIVNKNKLQQTARDAWTQVEVPRHLYNPYTCDRIIYPSDKYISAEEIQTKLLDAVITLQKNWRRWLAKQHVLGIKAEQQARIAFDERQKWLKRQDELDWLRGLEYHKHHPNTKDDFLLLFSDLQKWWEQEVDICKRTQTGAKMKASLWELTNKEAEEIKAIETEKQFVQRKEIMRGREKFLKKAAAPKVWKAGKGLALVETAGTQKARSLQDLYATLCKPKLVIDDRISILLQLMEVLQAYNTDLTKDLSALAAQEVDLLQRGIGTKNLAGLRRRIQNLAWQFTRHPKFNPETIHLSRLQEDKDGNPPFIMLCSSCGQQYMLETDTIDEATTCKILQQRFAKCKKCKYLENEGWKRKNLEVYKRMLRFLREAEEKRKTSSSLIYLLRPNDICYLTERVWKKQSCLSGHCIAKDLEFVRWDISKKWTPWNCILVTREEAEIHANLQDFKKIYTKEIEQAVRLKHAEARCYFAAIPRFLPYLTSPYADGTDNSSSEEGSDLNETLSIWS